MIHHEDDTVQLHHGDCLDVLRTLPDCSVDAVVTDPPYGLANTTPAQVAETITAWVSGDREHLPTGKGFMGKSWDAFVPPVAVWDECLRVLKPGGHALVFAGSRTHDLMTLGLRLAGFDIRDTISWLYGSGFPKSQDISKAIDKRRDDRADVEPVRMYLERARLARGLTRKEIAHDMTVDTRMVQKWMGSKPDPQAHCPTWDQWGRLRHLLWFDHAMDAEVWRLNGRKGTPGEAFQSREVVGQSAHKSGIANGTKGHHTVGGTIAQHVDITAPATPAAQQWQGWGSAMKPAWEPIVVARKPLGGTLAANVLQWGTGGLNVDGTRVPGQVPSVPQPDFRHVNGVTTHLDAHKRNGEMSAAPAGRWPTNVVLDDTAAEALDAEVPRASVNRSATWRGGTVGTDGTQTYGAGIGMAQPGEVRGGYGDSGGASRFFPVFKYQAKAPTRERVSYEREGAGNGTQNYGGYKVKACGTCDTRFPATVHAPPCGHEGWSWQEPKNRQPDKVAHPTVKPLELMRWLCRLVTPPSGVILEPFAGSGTTVEAAVLEGFRCIAVEREADYLPLIMARLERARPAPLASDASEGEPALFGEEIA